MTLLSGMPSTFEDLNTIVAILQWHASHKPDHTAYKFLADGEQVEAQLTYAELDQKARTIAASLQRITVVGDKALLLYSPGLEYIAAFLGCLYAGVIAVPAYPPHPTRIERTLPRLQAIVQDSQPGVALTSQDIYSKAEAIFSVAPRFADIHWLASDTLSDSEASAWRMPTIDRETIAFLQYTSGSTAVPKGVMVSHGNLLYNEAMVKAGFGHDEHSTFVGWLPLYHDMGLIGNVLQPLYIGALAVLMPPVVFLQRPYRWLKAISDYRAHTSGGPNFGFDLCVRKITDEQKQTLDLSSWKVAFNGAEPVRHTTLRDFTEAFQVCGFNPQAFYPCYGMAETTLFVTGGEKQALSPVGWFSSADLLQHRAVAGPIDGPGMQALVGCGHTWLDQKIAIVDPSSKRRCLTDKIGEVWVSGPNVAKGYLNREDINSETFAAQIDGEDATSYLRTGDLGFLRDGELFITGRHKDLIIIDGRNHYPQDIELTAEESHPALRAGCAAAFSIDEEGKERLVVLIEVERQHRTIHPDEPIRAIRRAIAQQHDLHAHHIVLLNINSILKTSSGKIQRRACKARFLEGTLSVLETAE